MNTLLKQSICAKLLLITTISSAIAANISFNIEGVNSNNGHLFIAVYKGKENYQSGKPFRSDKVEAKKGTVSVVFNNVEQGEYVIQVFHDEDNNGKMGTNLFGMPIEGFGFSNNAQPNFGPASYEDMQFQITDLDATINNSTTLIY